jgi:hypothetical protein
MKMRANKDDDRHPLQEVNGKMVLGFALDFPCLLNMRPVFFHSYHHRRAGLNRLVLWSLNCLVYHLLLLLF